MKAKKEGGPLWVRPRFLFEAYAPLREPAVKVPAHYLLAADTLRCGRGLPLPFFTIRGTNLLATVKNPIRFVSITARTERRGMSQKLWSRGRSSMPGALPPIPA